MTAPSVARIRFIPKQLGKKWGVYDVVVASFPVQRAETGLVKQDHDTEAAAQVEADRLAGCYLEGGGMKDYTEENLRVLKHEAETPMRGHDEDGTCCRRAQLGEES